jgi:hypothetical protein
MLVGKWKVEAFSILIYITGTYILFRGEGDDEDQW